MQLRCAVLCLLIFVFLPSTLVAEEFVASTEYGNVRGTLTYSDIGTPVRIWRGIPFASPPVGDLRFASPEPPAAWKPATLDCTTQQSICPQLMSVEGYVMGSEDCLYLDIYTPVGANATSKLPVMVWVYGGAYVVGDNRELGFYDATNLVGAHNYVHVAMNYRLSALGFLALPGLQAESPYHSTGNYALQDQQAALRFVQNNIANFGGDPDKVTLFGESAGAFSVCWHLVSPKSAGLFRAAIMESGNCENESFFQDIADANIWGQEYSEAVGCDPANHNHKELVECLRQLPLAEVLHGGVALKSRKTVGEPFYPLLYPVMPWGPAIDKSPYGLLDTPWNLIRAGNFNRVPVILGTNANEGNIFIPAFPEVVSGVSFPFTSSTVQLILEHFFNDTVAANVTQMYSNSADDWESVAALVVRDFFFACPARRVAEALSTRVPTYLYHFTFASPNWVDQWLLGDYHSSELEFVFNNPWPPLIHIFDADDKAMAATLGGYWTNFANTLVPHTGPAPNLLSWPTYSTKTSIMEMTVPPVVQNTYLDDICQYWDRVHD
eukprot:TRINITY_DN12836_c0_g1_i1.p1 TRINITY_DN12836_c0_g1~~TRINITY_DN12836_c0_g1_i1.p1  ORF type:complete len:551 (-),score=77.87 TRINITY_DN12836_c0_g1_i1:96-1748(-)